MRSSVPYRNRYQVDLNVHGLSIPSAAASASASSPASQSAASTLFSALARSAGTALGGPIAGKLLEYVPSALSSVWDFASSYYDEPYELYPGQGDTQPVPGDYWLESDDGISELPEHLLYEPFPDRWDGRWSSDPYREHEYPYGEY